MNEDKDMKLVFAPGCFDGFEGTQEELEEMIAHIKEAFASGDFLDSATEVDMVELEESDPELLEQLQRAFAADENPTQRKLH